MSKIPARIISIIGGFLFAIFAIEAGLRAAGSFAASRLADEVRDADPSRPIVIFCGDSNIYGVYVNAEETLPKVVERLSRRGGAKGVRCMNIGVPGSGSWTTLDQVRSAASLHPAAIVVTCGVNNYSTLPPDEGLGLIESLNIVKFVRRAIFNFKVQEGRGNAIPLRLGPGEAPIDGAFVPTGANGAAIRIVDREGAVHTFSHNDKTAERKFRDIEPRLKADFSEMLKVARNVNSQFVFATYLAGETPLFLNITETMRQMARESGVRLADCASAMEPVLLSGDPPPLASVPFEKRACRQNAILTADLHPTALGYEIEARIVNNALREAGLVASAAPDNPLEPWQSTNVIIPQVLQIDPDASPASHVRLRIQSIQKGDAIKLVVGTDGPYDWKNLQLPVNPGQFERRAEKYGIGNLRFTADESAVVEVRLPRDLLRELAKPVKVMCVVERGPAGGAAQRFPSAPIEINPEK